MSESERAEPPRAQNVGLATDAAVDRRRFRRTTTARAHLFAACATLALLLPGSLGLDWVPWRGVDGGVLAIALLAIVAYALPPLGVAPRLPALQTVVLAAGAVGGTAPFLALAAATGEPPAPRVVGVAGFAALLAGAVLAGRRGGLLSSAVALMVCVAAVLVPGPLERALLGVPAETARPTAAGEDHELVPARVELRGPLRSAVVRAGGGAPLRVEAALGPGETRAARAWIAAPTDRTTFGVEIDVTEVDPPQVDAGVGDDPRVRVSLDEVAAAQRAAIDDLVARARPAIGRPARPAPLFEALLVAWVVMVLGTSLAGRLGPTRPLIAASSTLALGVLGAAGAGALARSVPAEPAPAVRVFEGEAAGRDGARWIRVDRAAGVLSWAPSVAPAPVGVVVRDGALEGSTLLSARPDEGSSGETVDRVEVAGAPGAHVDAVRVVAGGLRGLREEVNTWGDLQEAWRRSPGGAWTAHGPWALGDPLPPEQEGAGPPGWALLGLPGGAEAFVGRAADGESGADPVTWVRVTRR